MKAPESRWLRWIGSLAGVALWLMLASGLPGATPVHAAPVDLFNNLSAAYWSNFSMYDINWGAQEFATDATHTKITSVVLRLCNSGTTGTYNVAVWTVAGGVPGTRVAYVAQNAPVSGLADCPGSSVASSTKAFSGLSLTLSASTNYYLVVSGEGTGGTGSIQWDFTNVDAGYPGAITLNSGTSWTTYATEPFQMQIASDTPTAVTLASFNATSLAPHMVRVHWTTATEADTLGFNVWRKAQAGQWKKLNAALIAGKNLDGVTPANYAFKDTTARSGKVYRYKLEMVGLNGTSEWSRVVRVRVK